MILWPFQVDLLGKIDEHWRGGKDLLVEKSRDMGATWLFAAWDIHHWLYEDSFHTLWGSRREAAVDDKTPASIFGKLDLILRDLPPWMLPGHFTQDTRANRMGRWGRNSRQKLLIKNVENGNVIQGESTNQNFSRSGRFSAVILDEFAFWDIDRLAWKGTADSTPVRFVISTPNGRGNMFADLRWGKAGERQIDVETLHWRLHPHKDEKWYAKEKKRRTDEDLAQEVDISYERSVRSRIYFDFDRNRQAAQIVDYDPNLPVEFGWDFGIATTAVLWIQPGPDWDLRIIDELEFSRADIDAVATEIMKRAEERGMPDPRECRHVGDPAGNNVTQLMGGLSVVQRLWNIGIRVDTPPRPLCTYENRIRKTTAILKLTRMNSECKRTVECFENYRYPDDVNPNSVERAKPLINQYSHLVTAFEYWCLMQPEPNLGDMTIGEASATQSEEAQRWAEWALARGRFKRQTDQVLNPNVEKWV